MGRVQQSAILSDSKNILKIKLIRFVDAADLDREKGETSVKTCRVFTEPLKGGR